MEKGAASGCISPLARLAANTLPSPAEIEALRALASGHRH